LQKRQRPHEVMHETSTRSPGAGQRRHGATGLDDGADGFVAEDRPRLHLGHVAVEDMEVGPADRRRVDPHDRVGRLLDRGVRNLVPGAVPGTVVHERLHGSSFRLDLSLARIGAQGISARTEQGFGFPAVR
jgi:hypothetical protein